METVTIYDPPMCCSTGVCGPDVDPELVSFAALLAQLSERGISVRRHNLGQEPIEFVKNPAVKAFLESEGTEALPLIFWDGNLHLKGRYPNKSERADWIRAADTRTGGTQ